MFDLVFSDSTKGSMAAAGWAAEQIESLWLELDIGDIAGLPDISCRKRVMFSILDGPEGIADEASRNLLWESNFKALKRIAEADEDVRIWWSDCPAEACGFYFAAGLLEGANVRIKSVKLPPYFDQGENICVHDSLKSVTPQELAGLLPLETDVSPALRRAAMRRWRELMRENAPLRAVVNGRLLSAPADFYDYTLRKQFTDGVFTVAQVIGRTMGENQAGVGDWYYGRRMRSMIESGELEIAEPDTNFYLTAVRKKA
jgi:hypothetical protein